MKKLIALLLAVSSMAMSTSALAATYDTYDFAPIGTAVSSEHKGVSRNFTTGSSSTAAGQPNWGSPVFRDTSMGLQYLPTYRSGDLLTFAFLCRSNGSVVKVNEGDVITFICSKQNASDYDNYTVQSIDQVTLTPSESTSWNYCTFKLRDNLEDGRYKLEVKLGDLDKKTFSFLIGTPSVELLYVNEIADGATPTKADKYYLKNGDAYCFGKATITGGANFSQTGTEFGFIFGDQKYTKGTIRNGNELTADAQAVADASVGNNSEIGGEAQYFFRMVIEDVPSIDQLPDVDVYLNK